MGIRIVRLGSERAPQEGTRIGTVRRPPRGVPKTEFARQNWYDVWYPNLAPSVEAMKQALATHSEPDAAKAAKDWAAFDKRYRQEMAVPDAARSLDLLAALSHGANFSVGCYCEDASRCHRSILRALLAERGAAVESPP